MSHLIEPHGGTLCKLLVNKNTKFGKSLLFLIFCNMQYIKLLAIFDLFSRCRRAAPDDGLAEVSASRSF